jgi:hypothetical protein
MPIGTDRHGNNIPVDLVMDTGIPKINSEFDSEPMLK